MFYACMEQVSNPSYKYLTQSNRQTSKKLVDPYAFGVDFTKYIQNLKKPVAPEGSTRLKLLYTNDWHGQTDNMGGILGASLQFDSSTKGQKLDTLKITKKNPWRLKLMREPVPVKTKTVKSAKLELSIWKVW